MTNFLDKFSNHYMKLESKLIFGLKWNLVTTVRLYLKLSKYILHQTITQTQGKNLWTLFCFTSRFQQLFKCWSGVILAHILLFFIWFWIWHLFFIMITLNSFSFSIWKKIIFNEHRGMSNLLEILKIFVISPCYAKANFTKAC